MGVRGNPVQGGSPDPLFFHFMTCHGKVFYPALMLTFVKVCLLVGGCAWSLRNFLSDMLQLRHTSIGVFTPIKRIAHPANGPNSGKPTFPSKDEIYGGDIFSTHFPTPLSASPTGPNKPSPRPDKFVMP